MWGLCWCLHPVQDDTERDVEVWLRRKFESRIRQIEVVTKEDLDLVGFKCSNSSSNTSRPMLWIFPEHDWLLSCLHCSTCCAVHATGKVLVLRLLLHQPKGSIIRPQTCAAPGWAGVVSPGSNFSLYSAVAVSWCLCKQKNHLSGLQRKLLKLSFYNVQQLMDVRRELSPIIAANSKRSSMADAVAALAGNRERPKVGYPCTAASLKQNLDKVLCPSGVGSVARHKEVT